MIMHAIVAQNLTKAFRTKRRQLKNAVDNLSLEIEAGEIFGFLGPNGAGKSTTIKMMLGLIRPDKGTIEIQGHLVPLPAARRKIGYLPEHPTFYDYLTASEYLIFTGGVFGIDRKTIINRSESILRRVGLWEVRNKTLRQYSKGMVQRLGLAHVLIHDPDVYVLDEPMSGLDPLGRAMVKEIILELKDTGKCVFLSSHIIADVEQICDRIGIIASGKLLAVEKVADVMLKGVFGYSVHMALPNGGVEEHQVEKEDLATFLASHEDSSKIRLVEPIRKNLEHHFLDLISQESS